MINDTGYPDSTLRKLLLDKDGILASEKIEIIDTIVINSSPDRTYYEVLKFYKYYFCVCYDIHSDIAALRVGIENNDFNSIYEKYNHPVLCANKFHAYKELWRLISEGNLLTYAIAVEFSENYKVLHLFKKCEAIINDYVKENKLKGKPTGSRIYFIDNSQLFKFDLPLVFYQHRDLFCEYATQFKLELECLGLPAYISFEKLESDK